MLFESIKLKLTLSTASPLLVGLINKKNEGDATRSRLILMQLLQFERKEYNIKFHLNDSIRH